MRDLVPAVAHHVLFTFFTRRLHRSAPPGPGALTGQHAKTHARARRDTRCPRPYPARAAACPVVFAQDQCTPRAIRVVIASCRSPRATRAGIGAQHTHPRPAAPTHSTFPPAALHPPCSFPACRLLPTARTLAAREPLVVAVTDLTDLTDSATWHATATQRTQTGIREDCLSSRHTARNTVFLYGSIVALPLHPTASVENADWSTVQKCIVAVDHNRPRIPPFHRVRPALCISAGETPSVQARARHWTPFTRRGEVSPRCGGASRTGSRTCPVAPAPRRAAVAQGWRPRAPLGVHPPDARRARRLHPSLDLHLTACLLPGHFDWRHGYMGHRARSSARGQRRRTTSPLRASPTAPPASHRHLLRIIFAPSYNTPVAGLTDNTSLRATVSATHHGLAHSAEDHFGSHEYFNNVPGGGTHSAGPRRSWRDLDGRGGGCDGGCGGGHGGTSTDVAVDVAVDLALGAEEPHLPGARNGHLASCVHRTRRLPLYPSQSPLQHSAACWRASGMSWALLFRRHGRCLGIVLTLLPPYPWPHDEHKLAVDSAHWHSKRRHHAARDRVDRQLLQIGNAARIGELEASGGLDHANEARDAAVQQADLASQPHRVSSVNEQYPELDRFKGCWATRITKSYWDNRKT
ncbi:hypothetical protein GGX14DRAFT_573732 [Mycena pura]|uniref:Uncharacterized protein n=1 Tax=Mycena pura TaxID=153505 RepID=A0AAD6UZC7_9AGAR|nr:hypothetical protein GGX14DRAFT_573732 [Mycena pura]